ncbi:MAG TPA: YceI family protein [Blastocatellia bacterium]|nr:YceI family protein [Blastocatellia bacterium]
MKSTTFIKFLIGILFIATTITVYSRRAERVYRLEAGKSNFIVHVGTAGLLSSFGHNHTIKITKFSGEARVNPDALEQSSLTMNIETGGLQVIDTDVSDQDRKDVQSTMQDKVLEVGKFSTASFKSTKVSGIQRNGNDAKLTLEGDLNLHGVQRHISIPLTVSMNGNELHAKGEIGLKQTDYKIEPVSVGMGSVKVKDEVRLTFEIVAVQ